MSASTLDLSTDAEVGVGGHLLTIVLPHGPTVECWIYDHPATTSVDVRRADGMAVVRTVPMPGPHRPVQVGVVIENR